jgi:hypothetical protein
VYFVDSDQQPIEDIDVLSGVVRVRHGNNVTRFIVLVPK